MLLSPCPLQSIPKFQMPLEYSGFLENRTPFFTGSGSLPLGAAAGFLVFFLTHVSAFTLAHRLKPDSPNAALDKRLATVLLCRASSFSARRLKASFQASASPRREGNVAMAAFCRAFSGLALSHCSGSAWRLASSAATSASCCCLCSSSEASKAANRLRSRSLSASASLSSSGNSVSRWVELSIPLDNWRFQLATASKPVGSEAFGCLISFGSRILHDVGWTSSASWRCVHCASSSSCSNTLCTAAAARASSSSPSSSVASDSATDSASSWFSCWSSSSSSSTSAASDLSESDPPDSSPAVVCDTLEASSSCTHFAACDLTLGPPRPPPFLGAAFPSALGSVLLIAKIVSNTSFAGVGAVCSCLSSISPIFCTAGALWPKAASATSCAPASRTFSFSSESYAKLCSRPHPWSCSSALLWKRFMAATVISRPRKSQICFLLGAHLEARLQSAATECSWSRPMSGHRLIASTINRTPPASAMSFLFSMQFIPRQRRTPMAAPWRRLSLAKRCIARIAKRIPPATATLRLSSWLVKTCTARHA
mmetsp:Transcript_31940/g.82773  ORF Transcript_31940/g.82773 Transcript_31940/m.82773 type:complete len:540 (+) Transcript_31940:161-1780(+)